MVGNEQASGSSPDFGVIVPCHPTHLPLLGTVLDAICTWPVLPRSVAVVTSVPPATAKAGALGGRSEADLPLRFSVVPVTRGATAGISRNAGAENLREEFVLVLDADDMIFPGAIAPALELLMSGAADLVTFGYLRISCRPEADQVAAVWGYLPEEAEVVGAAELRRLRAEDRKIHRHYQALPLRTSEDGVYGAHHGNIFVRRSSLKAIRYRASRIGEDIDFVSRALDAGESVAFIDQPWILWIRDQSTTTGPRVSLSRLAGKWRRGISRLSWWVSQASMPS